MLAKLTRVVFRLCLCLLPGIALSQSKTFTTTADFNQGSLLSVNTSIPDQLQLDQPGRPLPYVNIACSGKGTVVRIDVETGQIIGEYRTAPEGMQTNPSRTTVDKYGNTWVSNRNEDGVSGGVPKGSVTKIGITIGGTRCDADGTPNPGGQYLKPPFFYNTCVDRNNDGLIKTSNGLGNVLGWSNAGGANTNGGVSTSDDEAIVVYSRVLAVGARTVAIDEFNNLWVGGSVNRWHQKLNGQTGQPIPGTEFNNGTGGYGGFIDGNGVLWSSGSSDNAGTLRYTPNPLNPPASTSNVLQGLGNYGLGVDPNNGEVWHTDLTGNRITRFRPDGSVIGSYPHGYFYAQGCAVDAVGNVWVAHSLIGGTTIGHLRTDGTFIGNVQLPGSGPTGVAVDSYGKVWITCYNSDQAMRIDPNAGPVVNGYPLGAVDLVVYLGPGASPYNYSDMTGYVVINATVPSGTWTVVHDGGRAGIKWGRMTWTDSVPEGTGIRVEARASDNLLTLASNEFVPVEKGTSFCCAGVTGRFIEIRTVLFRQQTINLTPILYDLTVEPCDVFPNVPPVIASSRGCNGDTVKIAAGQTLSFGITASDADADQLVTITSSELPTGASMSPGLPVSGNPAQSTFSWPTTISDIGRYSFSFTANDKYCYSATCPVNVSVVPCPSIRCSGAGISCIDSCNGRATVTITGTPANYTYTWNTNPPSQTQSISRLCPGSYKVITDDGFACKDSCTVVIPAEPCNGFSTYTQGGWGANPKGNNPATYLRSKFATVFPNGLEIGCNNKLRLTSWQAVVDFLPSGTTPTSLPTGILTNPGSRYSNVFAGQLVAATLNVRFDEADPSFSPSPIPLKNLIIASGVFSGWTVNQLIAEANRSIGGCGSAYSFSQLSGALDLFNNNYDKPSVIGGGTNRCYLSCPIGENPGTLRPILPSSLNGEITKRDPAFSLFPNPAREEATLSYVTQTDAPLSIDLLSASGVKLFSIMNGGIGRSGNQITKVFRTDGVKSGTYFVRIIDGDQISIQRLVIIH
jgi:streptogramin lyase